MKALIAILLAITVGVVSHKITRMLDMEIIAETIEENEKLKIDLQGAQNEAYRECQGWMESNAKIQMVSGCYLTIEKLCTIRTKDIELCMETFMPVCGEL
jgi:hypothetical protein